MTENVNTEVLDPNFTEEELIYMAPHKSETKELLSFLEKPEFIKSTLNELKDKLELHLEESKPDTIIVSGGSRFLSLKLLRKIYQGKEDEMPMVIEMDSNENYNLYKILDAPAYKDGKIERDLSFRRTLESSEIGTQIMYLDDTVSSGTKRRSLGDVLPDEIQKIKKTNSFEIDYVNLVSDSDTYPGLISDTEKYNFIHALSKSFSWRNTRERANVIKRNEKVRIAETKHSKLIKNIFSLMD